MSAAFESYIAHAHAPLARRLCGGAQKCATATWPCRTGFAYSEFWDAEISPIAANDNMPLGYNVPGGGNVPLRYNCHLHLVHDTLNNLTSENLSVDGGAKTFDMAYTYDADGYMSSRTLPSGRALTVENDGLGRLTKISETGQVYVENINYYASGSIASMDYGNGQLMTQSLNTRLQPLRIQELKGR